MLSQGQRLNMIMRFGYVAGAIDEWIRKGCPQDYEDTQKDIAFVVKIFAWPDGQIGWAVQNKGEVAINMQGSIDPGVLPD